MLEPVAINSENVEIVSQYKYLGVTIDDHLTFSEHIHKVYVKCAQRITFLRMLKNLHVDKTILLLFYKSVIESVITFSFVSWFGNSTKKDTKKLFKIQKIVRRMDLTVTELSAIYNQHVTKMEQKIMCDPTRPLFSSYLSLPSNRGL